jgi:hypothetical protein
VPCVRGGVNLIQLCLDRLQRRLRNRFGPEGLGDENDADDEEIPNDPNPADIERAERQESQHLSAEGGAFESTLPHPVPEEPRLSSVTSGILVSIASVARDCIVEDPQTTKITTGVHPVLHSLISGTAPAQALSSSQQSQVEPTSLILSAKRCYVVEILDASIQLNYWINVIIFSSQISQSVSFCSLPLIN